MIQQQAALSILRTADLIMQESTNVLKPFELTTQQFNVLRILRGSPEGLPCGQIGERMINRDPDITRLLDRMESRKLIFRQRSEQDRRVVTASISECGLELLKRVDPVVLQRHQQQFDGMTDKQMRQIIELMQGVGQPRD